MQQIPVEANETIEGALATVRELLGMDAAFLTEFSGGNQVYAALAGDAESFGIEADARRPAADAYCAKLLSDRLPKAIPDTAAEPRVRTLPVTEELRIGAYAAISLRLPDGRRGSLCCLSHTAKPSLADRDLSFMQALASLIEDHLHRQAAERRALAERDRDVTRALAELRVARAALDASRAEMVVRLSRAVDYRDDETGAHTDRVGRYSERLARAAGLDSAFGEMLQAAATLHDAGKVAIPDAILLKPGRLDEEERRVMQTHAEIGFELLRNSGSEVLELGATIALTHHERFDGRGYPHGLAGEEIPVEGRIVAIVDAFDALTHDRVYRPAFGPSEALEIMARPGHLDPELLRIFRDRVVP